MNRLTYTKLFALAALVLAGALRAGDAPEVELRLSSGEIFVGENVEYYVTLKNCKNPSAPDMSAFDADFTVQFLGDQSQNQSSVFIVNGRKSENQSYGHLYGYRLTPKHAGDIMLPAPVFTIEGQKIAGRTAPLKVQAPEKQDLVLLEVEASKARVYPTQTFDVTLRILVKPLPGAEKNTDPLSPLSRQPPHIDANWVDIPNGLSSNDANAWLGKLVSNNGVGFTLNSVPMRRGFFDQAAVFNFYTGRETRSGLNGEKVEYFVYEMKRTFTGEKAGSYTFGPAAVKGQFAEGVNKRQYTGRRIVVFAPAKTVEVREVPTPRPATFSGGIGNYNIATSANPTTMRVGDPLTFTLEIQRQPGSGSLDLISAPDLTANEKLAADFDIIDKAPTGELKGDTKRFAYGLRPKRAGVSLPGLTLTVFNPDTEKFFEISTAPIALNITQTTQLNAGELVGALPSTQAQEIKSRNQGIFQNVTDVAELSNQHVNATAYVAAAAGAWAFFGGLSFFVSHWRRKSSDAAWQRRARARRAAEQNLSDARAALSNGRKSDVLKMVRDAIVGVIADMRNIAAAGMTSHEADAALASAGAAPELLGETVRLLESIEAAEYGSAGSLDLKALIDGAEALVPKLHRELDGRS